MTEYSNDADGYCQECGADTDEEWHMLCSDCYADEQGWRRPARAAPEPDERIDALEGRVDHLELQNKVLIGLAVSLGLRVDACELHGPLSPGDGGAA